jgi:ParB family transcriptional regulator, chromosome partitioning protein
VARRGGLGRGLGALIPPGAGETPGGFAELPVSAISANRRQPRTTFDEEALNALTASVREVGVLQPILVRATGPETYELVAGERRWRAAKRAGLQFIPALVRSADDAASLEQALVENLQREDLNAMDEAAAYQQLIEDFGLTHDEVAARVGRSRAAVTNMLRLFQLPPSVQRLVAEGKLSAGHARALLGSPDRSV